MSIELLDRPHVEMADEERPKATIFAGGSGGAATGAGFVEQFDGYDVTIVSGIADGGGSTKEVREVFGGGAPGDLRNIIASVSGNDAGRYLNERYKYNAQLDDFRRTGNLFIDTLAARNEELKLFGQYDKMHDLERVDATVEFTNFLAEYMLEETGRKNLDGHTWGNFLLTALRLEEEGDMAEAAKIANSWMETTANVIPSTNVTHDLLMDDGGHVIVGEGDIDEYAPKDAMNAELALEAEDPHAEVTIHPEAESAVREADVLIVAPGSLFTSHLAILNVEGMSRAIVEQQKRGYMVVMGNLAVEAMLPDMTVGGHAKRLHEVMNRKIDLLIYNEDTESLPASALPARIEQDSLQGEHIARAIGTALVSLKVVKHDASDAVAAKGLRTSVRHDVNAAAEVMRRELLASAV